MFRSCLVALGVLAACQDHARDAQPAPTPGPAEISVRDATGVLVAQLKLTRPCRASIGPQEMIVGGPPLVSTVGSTMWGGDVGSNGTTLTRDQERIARVFPVGDPSTAAVFDLEGVAQARIAVTGTSAVVSDKSSAPLRTLALAPAAPGTPPTITSDTPKLTITGTTDLVLAALLSAPELLPEVRMLAACERVLVTKDSK